MQLFQSKHRQNILLNSELISFAFYLLLRPANQSHHRLAIEIISKCEVEHS